VTLVAGTAIASTQVAEAATGCRAEYAVSSQWPGGFGADVTLTNLGDAINGWSLTWSFTAGQTVTQLWNGSFTQSGAQVKVTNAAWNGSIAAGGTASFGFNGTTTTTNPVPTSFTLNGTPCTGAVASQPPSSPAPSSSPSSSPSGPGAIDTTYPVTREAAAGSNNYYTVFRPSDPGSVGRTLPVVVFGNGACAHTDNSEVTRALTFIASHGFVVVDEGSVNGSANGLSSGSVQPSLLTGAITWAQNENVRSGAPLYQRLDLSRVATAGHSCGGLEALVAGEDPRVKAVISLDSGFFADGSFGYPRSELTKLHTPVLFMDGGSSDIAYANTQANYDLVTVQAILAEQSQAGHAGFIDGLRNGGTDASMIGEGMTVVVQFLDFQLNGNAAAKSYLLGASGLATKPSWTVRSKNF
jgi:predicted alpha/beta-hydrolase family hydrolase